MSQYDMFGPAPSQAPAMPTAETIRPRIEGILATLRAASVLPWTPADARSWQVVVPQMANWLPEAEREGVIARFETEMRRLQPQA